MSNVPYKSDAQRRKVLFSIMAHRSGKWVAFVTLVSIREISTLSIPFLFKIWRHFVSYVYVERWLIVGAWPHLAMKEFENSTEHNSKCSFRNTGKKWKSMKTLGQTPEKSQNWPYRSCLCVKTSVRGKPFKWKWVPHSAYIFMQNLFL